MNYFDHYIRLNDLSADGRRGRWPIFRSLYCRYLPQHSSARILDFGCGAGLLVEWLSKNMKYTNVTGIDIDESQVEFARRICGDAVAFATDSLKWLEQQAPFQMIFAMDVLEHLPDDTETLGVLRNKLTTDGCLVVTVPNAGSIAGQWLRYDDPTHERVYTENRLRYALESAGFTETLIRGDDVWRPHTWKGAVRVPLKALVRLLRRAWWAAEIGRLGMKVQLAERLVAIARI